METKELGLLNKLSPAETHYLIHGDDSVYKWLFQVTMMDLHFKGVLKIENRNSGGGLRVIYVSLEERFREYSAKSHEREFIDFFYEDTDVEYQLVHYVKGVKKQIGKFKGFIKNGLLKNTEMATLFGNSRWRDFLGQSHKLTPKGLAERTLQEKNLKALNEFLPLLIEKQLKKAREVLNIIRGNVFLLGNVDYRLLKLLSIQSFQENEDLRQKERVMKPGEHWADYTFPSYLFDLYIDAGDAFLDTDFDNGFDAVDEGSSWVFDWGGDSGNDWGSDCASGCSSCSGCGGCGD